MREDRKPNELLRHEREKKGWSQNKLAELIGADPTMISRWETGERKPDYIYQEKLCNLFQMDAVELGFIQKLNGVEPSLEFWPPDSSSPETTLRLSAWPALMQEECEIQADQEKTLFASLEVDIMAIALQWKRSSGSIVALQQLTYDSIRKHDAMHKDNHDTNVTRRQALQAIALLPIQMYGLAHLSSKQVLSEEALSLCAAGLTACTELQSYRPEGIVAMQCILAAYLSPLEQIARRSSPSQATAAHLAAQGYLLVGTIAEHYGRLDQMEAACRVARLYARRAHDVNLEAISINRLAVKFDYERRDRKSLETYLEALALPEFSTLTPLIQGRVYAGLAATHAYCQQKPQALSFLSQARDIYPQNPEIDPNYAFAYCNPGTFTMWEGLTLKHTDQYTQAVEAFSQFGSVKPLPGVSEVNRAAHLTYVASVAVRQRELEMACTYLNAAEEVAWTIQHEQRLAEMRDTLRNMQLLWPDEPGVRNLQEKILARHA